MRLLVACCAALAVLSLLLPSAPTYDPWAWLIWGREVVHGELSTAGGPAWKPLPVGIAALLSPLGGAAPDAWLAFARAGALLALAAAFLLGRRLAGGGARPGAAAAGVGAAVGVAACDRFLWHAGAGNAEGLLLACGLLAGERALAGRPRQALALGFAAALIRPEAWPFLLALAAWAAAREPAARTLAAALLAAVPLLWFGPEWLASGDPWRSADRARVPNPGAPALADVPALEALGRAAAIGLAPVLAAAAGLAVAVAGGRAAVRLLAPALAGVVWIALVAAMAQLLGTSGEERYLLPGVALVSVSGGMALGLGLARAARGLRGRAGPAGGGRPQRAGAARGPVPASGGAVRPAALALLAALAASAPFAAARTAEVARDLRAQAREARLFDGLGAAVAAAGGRDAVLRCGRPYVGPLRGPAVAWRLRVSKARVGFAPRAPGVAFVSRLAPGRPAQPRVPPGFRHVARTGGWRVWRACR